MRVPKDSMVITVTGATGFIGRRVLARFPLESHSVVVLARKNPLLDSRIHFAPFDAFGGEPGSEALDRADAIIHLAGEPVAQRWTPEAKRRIRDSRVLGTEKLIGALSKLRHRPQALVAASAIGYYGERGNEELTESSSAGSGFLAEVSRDWEKTADLAAPLGIRVVKIRLGVVLGRGGGALKKMLPAFRAGLGGRLASGKQWMSWIHIDDLVELIHFAVTNPEVAGIVNGVAPNPVTNAGFTRVLAGALGRPAIFPVPALVLRSLYGEMAEMLLASQRVLPKAAENAGFRFRYPEIRAALESVVK